MPDVDDFEQYQITEADIDKVLNYLLIEDPTATAEDAIAFLEHHAQLIHEAGHVLDDKKLRELYDKFKAGDV